MTQSINLVPKQIKDLVNNHDRLVHLDLKGAPPKLSYLKEFLVLIKKHGATGILMEYEDTFPYTGQLQHLQKKVKIEDEMETPFYSSKEVQELLAFASELHLTVIPLVQTFGHLEFVLKHSRHTHLRECSNQLSALCPRIPQSFELVQQMISQIAEAHPKATRIHLGMDEVLIGVCERCKVLPREKLFLEWGVRVLGWVRRKYPHLTPIIWDDMLRGMTNTRDIKASGLGSMAEVMVWKYDACNFNLPTGYLQSLSSLFPGLWIASAYKGASGSTQMVVPIQHHVNNQMRWLNTITGAGLENYRGIAVTGWQRYDHMAVLCELIPVSIPSLILCLEVLREAAFTKELHEEVSQSLGFKELVNINPHSCPVLSEQGLSFPGCTLYSAVHSWYTFRCTVNTEENAELSQGWLSDYSLSRGFVSPYMAEMITKRNNTFLTHALKMEDTLASSLSSIFLASTVREWLECNVTPIVTKLTKERELCARLSKTDVGACRTSTDCDCKGSS